MRDEVNDGKIGEGLTKADEAIVRQLRMEGKGEGFQAKTDRYIWAVEAQRCTHQRRKQRSKCCSLTVTNFSNNRISISS